MLNHDYYASLLHVSRLQKNTHAQQRCTAATKLVSVIVGEKTSLHTESARILEIREETAKWPRKARKMPSTRGEKKKEREGNKATYIER